MTKDENDKLRSNELPLDAEEGTVPVDTFAPKGQAMSPIGSLLDDALARTTARAEGQEVPVPMPWPEIASIYRGGLWPGMHLLVAGTGAGKTQWALQLALHAAQQGIGVGYIGLELDKLQVTLRLASLVDGRVPWSDWFTGCRDDRGVVNREALGRLPAALDKLRALPVHLEFARPGGWPASRLTEVVREVRTAHPDQSKPVLVVLDFLQLVGDEPGTRGVELRERIGRAAYFARQVASEQNAAVLLISSTARTNYMGGEEMAATARAVEDGQGLHNPDAIVGLGKESGETEYAADSVAVLARMASVNLHNGRAILFAAPKVRAGRARWDALKFNGHRFNGLEQAHIGAASEADEAHAAVVAAGKMTPDQAAGRATKRQGAASESGQKDKKNGAAEAVLKENDG